MSNKRLRKCNEEKKASKRQKTRLVIFFSKTLHALLAFCGTGTKKEILKLNQTGIFRVSKKYQLIPLQLIKMVFSDQSAA